MTGGPAREASSREVDVLVVGAGVFGVWCAHYLRRAGKRVAVVEAIGPAHSGASSGGESRVTRSAYGEARQYAEWARQSLADWQALSDRLRLPILHRLGVLFVHRDGDPFVEDSVRQLSALDIPHERLTTRELRERYPVMRVGSGESGLLELEAGALMARRAVQSLASELAAEGVDFIEDRILPIHQDAADGAQLPFATTRGGRRIRAEQFVFACGPWLDRVCPEAMAGRLFVTRQEVFFFAVAAGATGHLPTWADLPFYGFPSLEGRGFKVANDTHGTAFDPETTNRRPSDEGEEIAREFLSHRFPSLAAAALNEARVCQYENSSNGDFVIDRHPALENVWLVGCGSGHGFKHGPAVGRHVAALVDGSARPIERFSLQSKSLRQNRELQ